MNSSEALITLDNVGKHFETPDRSRTIRILDGVSLRIQQGESLAIVGPSGSGKSTLLNLMGALDKPSEGIITFNGRNLTDLAEEQLARIRNREIGFVFQLHHLLPQCTALENVLLPSLPLRAERNTSETSERAHSLLDHVGLSDRIHYRPGHLSGGERQRVALVRALINKPKILLADEPTGSLDIESANQLAALLTELNHEQNVTLVVVTHSIELAGRMKQLFKLRNGRLEPDHGRTPPTTTGADTQN